MTTSGTRSQPMKTVYSARNSIFRALSPRRSRSPSPGASKSAPPTPRGQSGVSQTSGGGGSSKSKPMPAASPAATPSEESNEVITCLGAIPVGGSCSSVTLLKTSGVFDSVRESAAAAAASIQGPRAIAAMAKRSLLTKMQKLVAKKLESTYGQMKLTSITPDRRMPHLLRVTIHEVADTVWEDVQDEAMRMFEKMMRSETEEIDDDAEDRPHRNPVSSPPSPPSSPPEDSSDAASMQTPKPKVQLPPGRPPQPRPPLPLPGHVCMHVLTTAPQTRPAPLPLPPPEVQEVPVLPEVEMALHAKGRNGLACMQDVPEVETASQAPDGRPMVRQGSVREEVQNFAAGTMPLASVAGAMHRSLGHDRGTMRIVLVSARGLKAADSNGLSDPYCMLSMGRHRKTSTTIKKTLNPKWNEEFQFKGEIAKLGSKLLLRMYDYDLVGFDDALGNAEVIATDRH